MLALERGLSLKIAVLKKMPSYLLSLVLLPMAWAALPREIRIAAIFDQFQDPKHELAFRHGIRWVNGDRSILGNHLLVPEIVKVPFGNRFETLSSSS